MHWLKEDNIIVFNVINKESKIISEINEITKLENITANEVISIDKYSINLLCEYEKALIPLHDMSNKKCPNANLKGYCCADGFLLKCKNCSFTYPQNPIAIEKNNSPTIYNIINQVNVYEDIKNKDTLQVCNYILNIWNNAIYYNEFNKQWYLFNEDTGIYIIKTDNNIIKKIDDTIDKEQKKGKNEIFYEWIYKIEYKKQLLQEIKTKFDYIDNIKIDNNSYLIGLQNGIYDLTNNIFRKGEKNEYITLQCKYNYNHETNINIAINLLKDYFPEKEDFQYVLDLLSLCIEGCNRTQSFIICYGFSASNGKSFLMERLAGIFNDYSGTFPVNMITNKMREAGNANVDLINFKNKRFMYCSEPEANCKFNTNFLKQLTGDTITARKNHSNEIEKIKPTYNLFICCNRLPGFDTYDEGISRRLKIIEFKNKFVDKPKNKNENQRKNYTENEIETIEKSLLHLLIHNYINLKKKDFKIIEPNYLQILRESYGESNNEVKEILDEYIEESDNEYDYISKKEIKKILKEHKIKIQDQDLLRLIPMLYKCEFYLSKQIQNIRLTNIFLHLKNKNMEL
jgi:P4 family phage/plasmid primase-like protien